MVLREVKILSQMNILPSSKFMNSHLIKSHCLKWDWAYFGRIIPNKPKHVPEGLSSELCFYRRLRHAWLEYEHENLVFSTELATTEHSRPEGCYELNLQQARWFWWGDLFVALKERHYISKVIVISQIVKYIQNQIRKLYIFPLTRKSREHFPRMTQLVLGQGSELSLR